VRWLDGFCGTEGARGKVRTLGRTTGWHRTIVAPSGPEWCHLGRAVVKAGRKSR
jgi:hypothetical protein